MHQVEAIKTNPSSELKFNIKKGSKFCNPNKIKPAAYLQSYAAARVINQ